MPGAVTEFRRRVPGAGFRFLMEQGTVFRNAHHAHANTETILGHATLATGATGRPLSEVLGAAP